ncbi:hypothetical protein GTP58_20225 [Duganella sp. CY15W]|uniref:hypothetical protein n=1 Tax=Duganella sp. CY15W TaxID=2692172 RepID=UPI00136DED28|nr:hypothetical protein [Duganella sp. CY15W]MYM30663.1 hypothetical protein [Duganella sp. CY15W]
MDKWKVQVVGDDVDIRLVMQCFGSEGTFIEECEKEFFMFSESFGQLSSHHEVLLKAMSILSSWNAIVVLQWPSFSFLKSGLVIETHEDGRSTRYHSGFAALNIRFRFDIRLGCAEKETSSQAVWRNLSDNPRKELVLKLWGHPNRTWTQLYRIVEEMEAEVGGLSDAGIADKSELKRFKSSANNAAVAGLESRHRSGQFDAPSNPMNLTEAEEMLRHSVWKFLKRERTEKK